MTAPNMEAPGEVGTEGRAQGTVARGDFASADAERKLFETVRAAAALSGVQVYRLGDGSYLLQRWNLHRELPDLDAATALLRRMGVQV